MKVGNKLLMQMTYRFTRGQVLFGAISRKKKTRCFGNTHLRERTWTIRFINHVSRCHHSGITLQHVLYVAELGLYAPVALSVRFVSLGCRLTFFFFSCPSLDVGQLSSLGTVDTFQINSRVPDTPNTIKYRLWVCVCVWVCVSVCVPCVFYPPRACLVLTSLSSTMNLEYICWSVWALILY